MSKTCFGTLAITEQIIGLSAVQTKVLQ